MMYQTPHNCRKFNLIIFLALLLMLFALFQGEPVQAHPHMFMDCELTLEFDDEGLTGIRQRWILDEMFTTFLLEDFDLDQDMTFNTEEVRDLKENAFDNLVEFGYFTYIKLNDTHIPVETIEDFSAEIDDEGRAIYQFFVPCAMEAEQEIAQALIAVFDDTYYTDVVIVPEALTVRHPEHIVVRQQIRELPDLRYYYDEIVPKGVIFAFQKKP